MLDRCAGLIAGTDAMSTLFEQFCADD